MPALVKLSKADARRAMATHHFAPCATQGEAFERLRSVQFDPIAPVGCNHDLVLQARVPGYRVGDWETLAYADRAIYDGWDKQASLVPFEGWPLRRIYHATYRRRSGRVFEEHPEAVATILGEIEKRGPLLPKECEFQEHRPEWKGTWYGPSLTKQVLRSLWHAGIVMTADRRKGQHLYDLAERVVPPHLFALPLMEEEDAMRELILERHRAVGLLRPSASAEVWSYGMYAPERKAAISRLVAEERLVPVEVEGVVAHATPEFLRLLDAPLPEANVTFVAPLDQLLWDRKMVAHLYGFDYVWEIYTPEAKRRWGYYVLPILFGTELVARAEFWSRAGVLEIRRWHSEAQSLSPEFLTALEGGLRRFMHYCSAQEIRADAGIDPRIRSLVERLSG